MAKHARVTLTGCLSLNIGGVKLQQNKTVTITDPAQIAMFKGQSGVSVEEFNPAPAKPAVKAEAPTEPAQATETGDETDAAKAQLANRRKMRPAKGAEAQG